MRAFTVWQHLNQLIAKLLIKLNNKPFQKLPGCRASLFNELDAPALQPLPRFAYEHTKIQRVLAGKDSNFYIEKR